MKNVTLRIIALLGLISIVGIVITQLFWFRQAFDLKEKEFNQTASIALQSVAEQLLTINNQQIPNTQLVTQLSSNYFVVSVNGEINANVLEYLLKNEFKKRNLILDFEYGVYDCFHQKMVYGKYIHLGSDKSPITETKNLPEWRNDLYYFGVNFPNRKSEIVGSMNIWMFSTLVLLVVVLFFGFSLLAIFRQKQLSEIQKDFVNNMTHEFKTPLSTILVSAKLLSRSGAAEHESLTEKYTGIIQQEATRLKNQVERVLQVTADEAKQTKFKMEEIDLQSCVDEAMNGVEVLLHEKDGTIEKEFLAKQTFITGDYLHLTNAIYNLLDNALKYTEQKPHIIITLSNKNEGIELSVSDNGIGIPKKYLNRIFSRFYRVPTGNVHNVKGFGLGLFYIRKVIAMHKGTVKVESEESKGSKFILWFPILKKKQ